MSDDELSISAAFSFDRNTAPNEVQNACFVKGLEHLNYGISMLTQTLRLTIKPYKVEQNVRQSQLINQMNIINLQ